MNKIDLQIKSIKVESSTRQVRAEWKREMIQDLKSMHSIDLSKEIHAIEALIRGDKRVKKISKILDSVKHCNSF